MVCIVTQQQVHLRELGFTPCTYAAPANVFRLVWLRWVFSYVTLLSKQTGKVHMVILTSTIGAEPAPVYSEMIITLLDLMEHRIYQLSIRF